VAMEFDAGGSRDQDGAIVGYAWSFGDGAIASVGTASHAYSSAGTYTVNLTITDSSGQTAAVSRPVTVDAPGATLPGIPPAPGSGGSNFKSLGASVDASTGSITFNEWIENAGTLSWVLVFPNGKFGVFAAKNAKCRAGLIRLTGKCRPAKILFAKGRVAAYARGAVSFSANPTASAMKALKNALKRKKGLPVTATLTFQSSPGGVPVSHTQTLTMKLRK
jgi:hypothetical protein